MNPEHAIRLRDMLRSALVAAASALTAPCWIPARLQRAVTGGEGCFAAASEFLSLFPGAVGIYLRRGFYKVCLDAFAEDCHLGFGTTLAHMKARIGRGVYIGNRCTLGQVEIGDHVTIGSNVDLLSGRHQHHFDDLDRPIQAQGGSFSITRIGRNTWVGNSAVIMADVGADCIIGAGSVVVKPIPERSIAAGNPATVKRERPPRPSSRPATRHEPTEGAGLPC